MAGITLIALIITIVILIILAGVVISLSLGNNGLFNKAQEAKEKYTNAQDYEETEIAKISNEIDKQLSSSRLEENWTSLGSKTGTTAFDLSEISFNEIYIEVCVQNWNVTFNIPKINLTSTSKMYSGGYSNDKDNWHGSVFVDVSNTQITLNKATGGTTDYTSSATISVSYK